MVLTRHKFRDKVSEAPYFNISYSIDEFPFRPWSTGGGSGGGQIFMFVVCSLKLNQFEAIPPRTST